MLVFFPPAILKKKVELIVGHFFFADKTHHYRRATVADPLSFPTTLSTLA